MMKILQISSELNVGSIGKISEHISDLILKEGWESYIAYGREAKESKSNSFRIGTEKDLMLHGISTRLFDNHGFASVSATKELLNKLEEIKPDLVHLHHLHGYFVNVELLFNFLKKSNTPVVWTFHDCWSFTGHCTHYEFVGCEKWKTQCFECPQKNEYPGSFLIDRSFKNYNLKKSIFQGHPNLTIVPVSEWLGAQVQQSFLKEYNLKVISNGIDLEVFKPRKSAIKDKYGLNGKYMVLGVAGNWEAKKGLADFLELRKLLSDDYDIVLVGLNSKLKKEIGDQIIGIEKTEDQVELSELYSAADVFLNPTLEDSFPTTNLEALACGIPIITYRTGGSVEAVHEQTGYVVEKKDVLAMREKVELVITHGKTYYSENCRSIAEKLYNKNINFSQYIDLYRQIFKVC